MTSVLPQHDSPFKVMPIILWQETDAKNMLINAISIALHYIKLK